jgi:hypothetical protein
MATPHVAGIAAVVLSSLNVTFTPQQLCTWMQGLAIKDQIQNKNDPAFGGNIGPGYISYNGNGA